MKCRESLPNPPLYRSFVFFLGFGILLLKLDIYSLRRKIYPRDPRDPRAAEENFGIKLLGGFWAKNPGGGPKGKEVEGNDEQ